MLNLNAWELTVLNHALEAYAKANGSTFGSNKPHLDALCNKVKEAVTKKVAAIKL